MARMVLSLAGRVKLEVRRLRRSTRDAGLAMRCQVTAVSLAHLGKRITL